MIYITGDTHGFFYHVNTFCEKMQTSKEDILIILGDAGINYYENQKDIELKQALSMLPITIFSIHGNHEKRPESITTYKEKEWNHGIVYYEEQYPNLFFAKDGEIYDLDGLKTIAIGGAYSIDKEYRLYRGWHWFSDEQPSEEIKKRVEEKLNKENWEVDVVLSHTAPFKYEPTELFISGIDQTTVDKSTELWLDKIESQLQYKKWYFGHYHGIKKKDKMEMMYNNISEFFPEREYKKTLSFSSDGFSSRTF